MRSLTIALVLNAAYTLVEAIAALLAGSLSLLADAGHNLSDVVALSVAAGAVMLARRPATPNRSFGLRRAEILAALVNAVALIVIALVVFVGAIRRFADPPEVPGGWLVAVASIGLLVNLVGAAAVFRRDGDDLNLRAAYVHLVGDALGSVGVIVTGLVIVTTGWRYADPIAGVLIAVYLVVSSWSVLRESTLVLLEATPRGLDAEVIGRAIATEPGVVEVHDLHVWQITSGFPSLSAHVLVHEGDDCHAIRRAIERMLDTRFGDHPHDAAGRPRARRSAPHDLAALTAVSDVDERTHRRVTRSVLLPLSEIEVRVSRSSGPGGQHANTSETRVEAVLDVEASTALTEAQKRRVVAKTAPVLRAVAQDERSQARNRELAIDRLVAKLAEALHVERRRRADEADAGVEGAAARVEAPPQRDEAAAAGRHR